MPLIKTPTLVNQIDDSTCAHACLSMVTGVPIRDVIETLGNSDGLDERHKMAFLIHHAILPTQIPGTLGHQFPLFGLYIVTAASLNRPGRLHSVVVHTCDDGHVTYDPQHRRKGRKYYPYKALSGGKPALQYAEVLYLEDCPMPGVR